MINPEGIQYHGKSYSGEILKQKELARLKQEGFKLDDSGKTLYTIRFLWNNKVNRAYQPGPFRVNPNLNDKLAKEAIDMPWLVGPDPEEHVENKKNPTAEGLLKIQANYSIGDIKAVLKSDTGNFYGIIAVYPDYEQDVLEKRIPPLTSPTFNIIKSTKLQDHYELEDAEFLNLNSVISGGYDAELTSITGVCRNGIRQCMSELAPYAAAGDLKASRKDSESFSSAILKNIKPMSQEGDSTPNLETVAKDLDATKQEVVSLSQTVSGISTKVDAIATKIGLDNTETSNDGGNPPDQAAAAGPNQKLAHVDISKHPDFIEVKKTLKEVKTLSDKREKEFAAIEQKNREKTAASIVELLNGSKNLSEEEKAAQVKQWIEKKDADGNLENIELVESTLKAAIPKQPEVATASGPYGIPGINGDIDPAKVPKNSSILAKTMRGMN